MAAISPPTRILTFPVSRFISSATTRKSVMGTLYSSTTWRAAYATIINKGSWFNKGKTALSGFSFCNVVIVFRSQKGERIFLWHTYQGAGIQNYVWFANTGFPDSNAKDNTHGDRLFFFLLFLFLVFLFSFFFFFFSLSFSNNFRFSCTLNYFFSKPVLFQP